MLFNRFLCGKYLFKLLMEWKFLFGTKKVEKSDYFMYPLLFFQGNKDSFKISVKQRWFEFLNFYNIPYLFSWIFLHSNKIFPSISDFLFSKSCTSLVVPISRFYWGLKNESNSHTKAIFKGLKENRQKSIVELHVQYSICAYRGFLPNATFGPGEKLQ